MAPIAQSNGLMTPPQTENGSTTSSPPRVILAGGTGRILCVADIRGDYHELNRLIREHEATAVIHTGDFGFMNADSLDRMGDKILRHLLQFSPLIASGTRNNLLAIPPSAGRQALIEALNNSSIHFPLSQFPHLLSGAITFPVPVFTVWGLIEDVRVLEKFRTGEYEVHNLSIIDEATSRVVDVGGLRLRLFGLGGAVAPHKMFDNGEGLASIAGGQGTMWATALQIGELIDTAQRVYDQSETRLFISSASVSRNGLLSQLSSALKADLTISGGLHFRYPVSYNEFSVHGDFDAYRSKLNQAREIIMGIYQSVKDKVEPSLNETQQALLKKALAVVQKVPETDDGSWTNAWHWVLSDAACGHLLFSITSGRVSAETKSAGLNFAHRIGNAPAPPSAPKLLANPLTTPSQRPAPAAATSTETRPPAPSYPAVRPGSIGGAAVRPPVQPSVRPVGALNGTPTRPPMGQNQIRPGFNGPPGMAMRGVRPPLPGKPGSGGFGTGAFGNAGIGGNVRPAAQLPRGPRATSGGAPPAAKAEEATATTVTSGSDSIKAPPTGPAKVDKSGERGDKATPVSTPVANGKATPAPADGGKKDERAGSVNAVTTNASGKKEEGKEVRGAKRDDKRKEKPAGIANAGVNGEKNGTGSSKEATDKEDEKKADASVATATAPATGSKEISKDAKDGKDASKDEKPTSTTNSASASRNATPSEEKEGHDLRVRKPALYCKGLPSGTTEDDLKAMFKEYKDKITSVKVIPDNPNPRMGPRKPRPDIAYIEFSTEEENTSALKECSKKVKDTDISVVVSNPPVRTGARPPRGGFGGRGRGGRGGGRGGFGGERKEGAVASAPAPAAAAAASGAK